MRFRNAIRLLVENFGYVYKVFVYMLVILLIASALCCSFVLPEIMQFVNSAEMQALITDGQEFFRAFFAVDAKALGIVKEAILGEGGSLRKVMALLTSMSTEIILICIGCLVVSLLQRFMDTLCCFAVGSLLNDKMTTYAEGAFHSAYIANLGKASAYSLIYVPFTFVYDMIMMLLVVLSLAFSPILLGVFLSVTIIAVSQSLKLTITGRWMPAIIADNQKLREALKGKKSLEKNQKRKEFSTYLVCVYLIIIVNVLAIICTFGSALLITVPASYVFLVCIRFVHYYTVEGKKYFITYEKIEKNTDHGDKEHFFEYLQEETKEEKISEE